MALKGNLLYYLRCFQLCFALAFLIVICYSGVHRGWWDNVTGAIALGVITSLLTLLIIFHAIFIQFHSNPFSARGPLYTYARIGLEILTFLLWLATIALMLRHQGGCGTPDTVDGVTFCFKNDEDKNPNPKLHSDQPVPQWWIALAFAIVDAASFVMSIVLVWKDNRANKIEGDGPGFVRQYGG